MFGVPAVSMKGHRYTPLDSEDTLPLRPSRSRKGWASSIAKPSILLLSFLVVCGSGFYAGRWSASALTDELYDSLQLRTYSRVLEYNATYGEPSNSSNAIWRSLIPRHGGFFNHPTIAPNRSVFSVYHQLHCLDGMRKGYWAVHTSMNEQRVLDEEDILKHTVHFEHCVDYLRQVLMCRPDLTLEIQNPALKAVEGFGVEHMCKDWDELTTFVTEWETWGRD